MYEQARARKLENGYPESLMYLPAFMQGDAAGMQPHFDAAMGKLGIEDILLTMQSDTEAYYGHVTKAREFSQRAGGLGPEKQCSGKTMLRRRPRSGRPTARCMKLSSAMSPRRCSGPKPPGPGAGARCAGACGAGAGAGWRHGSGTEAGGRAESGVSAGYVDAALRATYDTRHAGARPG